MRNASGEPTVTLEAASKATGISERQWQRVLAEKWTRPKSAPPDELLVGEVLAEAVIQKFSLKRDRAHRVRLSFHRHDVLGLDYVVVVDKDGFAVPMALPKVDEYTLDISGNGVFDPRPLLRSLGVTESTTEPESRSSSIVDQPPLFPEDGALPFE